MLRKDTRVWTTDGVFPIEELEGKQFFVRNLYGQVSPATCWLSGKNKPLWEIELTGGIKYYATREHKWPIITDNGIEKYTTPELLKGMYLPLVPSQSKLTDGILGCYDDGFIIGWNLGDGWITNRGPEGTQIGFIVSEADRQHNIHTHLSNYLKTRCEWTGNFDKEEINVCNSKLISIFNEFGVVHKSKGLPSTVWTSASEDFERGWWMDCFPLMDVLNHALFS